jgi:uncharacterized protein (DUF1499 family)
MFSWQSFLPVWGSKPADFEELDLSGNPLPPCPNSPNCVRHSRSIDAAMDTTFDACLTAIEQVHPEKVTAHRDQYRIEVVCKVFLFRDDLTIQLTPSADNPQSSLHIKSASRQGYSDLGVNRRRVAALLKELQRVLTKKD